MLRGAALGVLVACAFPAVSVAQFDIGTTSWMALPPNPVVREGDATVDVSVAFQRLALLVGKRTYRITTQQHERGMPDVEPVDRVITLPAAANGANLFAVKVRLIGDRYPEDPEYITVRIDSGYPGDNYATNLVIVDSPDPPPPPGRRGRTTLEVPQLRLARAANGGLPNAPATEPVLSGDARDTRFAAYTSRATNITGETNGRSNVFLVKRGGTVHKFGSPWEFGSTALASKGRGGQPANGDSWGPVLGGWVRVDDAKGPVCLAFVSQASNLVAGDRNGRADVFWRRASGGSLRRLAAPGRRPATEALVSGDCKVRGLIARGTLYVTKPGSPRLQRIAGGVHSAQLTFNGKGVSYVSRGKVYARRIGGRARFIGKGTAPSPDGGATSSAGRVRHVAYESAGGVYRATVGRKPTLVAPGSAPSMSAGGEHVMFAHGAFFYLFARSNAFGKRNSQGVCPPGQGDVTRVYTSARANYVAFACAAGAIYLSYIGPKSKADLLP